MTVLGAFLDATSEIQHLSCDTRAGPSSEHTNGSHGEAPVILQVSFSPLQTSCAVHGLDCPHALIAQDTYADHGLS